MSDVLDELRREIDYQRADFDVASMREPESVALLLCAAADEIERLRESQHIREKVLRYVLFVLTDSVDRLPAPVAATDFIATDLCDSVQMAADASSSEIERLRAELAEAHKWRGLAGCNSFEEMHAAIGQLASTQAELAEAQKDTARLDALDALYPEEIEPGDQLKWRYGDCESDEIRDIADAAMEASDGE